MLMMWRRGSGAARLIRKGDDAVPASETKGAAILSAATVNKCQSSCSLQRSSLSHGLGFRVQIGVQTKVDQYNFPFILPLLTAIRFCCVYFQVYYVESFPAMVEASQYLNSCSCTVFSYGVQPTPFDNRLSERTPERCSKYLNEHLCTVGNIPCMSFTVERTRDLAWSKALVLEPISHEFNSKLLILRHI